MTATEESPDDRAGVRFDSVERAVAEIARGRAVIVVDDEDRENEGDLIFAAEKATPELMAFLVRNSSGYVCATLSQEAARRLRLSPMVALSEDPRGTAYAVTCDANTGTTGISAASRAETVRRLADPATLPDDLVRPGHIVPLIARPNGVLARPGHTEASIDLAVAAGLNPCGVLCEVVSVEHPTEMARTPELRQIADRNGLAMISIDQLIRWRRSRENTVERVVETRLPTEAGEFRAIAFRNTITGIEHLALVCGSPDADGGRDVSVRLHSECLTGDVFESRRCDCGQQLHRAMRMIQERGRGVIVYLRGQEGRGIGLASKLKAYRLQDEGLDTVDANLALGLPVDAREFDTGAHILAALGVRSVNLLTNNPAKGRALEEHGVSVTSVTSIPVEVTRDSARYLRTKRDRMGHTIPALYEAADEEDF